ncbi:MAG: UDP-N-acetylglucosamine 1-carboxyvinyltransferase [Ilumatobacter fluminis]|uniref:UDP-N-acetylglucosamine 1-carboxyvinyltransferase n=1 Tax=Ilumatobacter fluminis TaxID=467091 RepID=A0A4R7I0I6_9ACTN|nr:UDP-N-acetylglucosamine 1-carboxyvinyltransferase [Ilumatobacter fluminis]TDT16941.1 UDP-N-acetylglucosamine 1-carboxyvinyltransferase [Ilumatobacter fluminis]
MTANERGDEPGCCIRVHNAGPLSGEVVVPGAKNSVLKLMAASILADGTYEITNVPAIVDVGIMADLLRAIGLEVTVGDPGLVTIVNRGDLTPIAPFELVAQMRASINVLGPLLTRCGYVRVSMPGGDDFGSRPIDMHVAGLTAMGATFDLTDEYVEARADRLHGADIMFDFPSVGATENVLTAAVLADGVTTIDNAAREPELIDLCEFLVSMGARIEGIGTSRLIVTGVGHDEVSACLHETVPDRIQAATYIAACAVTGGQIDLLNAQPDHMQMVLSRFRDMGLDFRALRYGLRVSSEGRMRSTDIATLPYPGIATDYKPLIMTMLSVADGVAIVTENIYPGRFKYVDELQRLGADIRTNGHHAVVRGVPRLVGTDVVSHDIRAGAAMVVAGLAAEGTTTISGVHHIDRGYDDLVGRLQSIGAGIERV